MNQHFQNMDWQASGGHTVIGSFIWLVLSMGFGWCSYFTGRLLLAVGVSLIAQVPVPEFRMQDWANLGGFAMFAGAMYFMHRQTIQQFRDDLKDERALRDKQTNAIAENTAATRSMTEELRKSR